MVISSLVVLGHITERIMFPGLVNVYVLDKSLYILAALAWDFGQILGEIPRDQPACEKGPWALGRVCTVLYLVGQNQGIHSSSWIITILREGVL